MPGRSDHRVVVARRRRVRCHRDPGRPWASTRSTASRSATVTRAVLRLARRLGLGVRGRGRRAAHRATTSSSRTCSSRSAVRRETSVCTSSAPWALHRRSRWHCDRERSRSGCWSRCSRSVSSGSGRRATARSRPVARPAHAGVMPRLHALRSAVPLVRARLRSDSFAPGAPAWLMGAWRTKRTSGSRSRHHRAGCWESRPTTSAIRPGPRT